MVNREFNDLDTEEKQKIVHDSISLMRTITETFGTDRGMELWGKISEALGNDIKGDIFFGMISGKYQPGIVIVKTISANHFVSSIKAVRVSTGWGLKQAKDFCDLVRDKGPQTINCVDRETANKLAKELAFLGCEVR